MSAEHVLTMLNEHEVKFVDLRFTDTKGKEQHVTIPAHQVNAEFFEEGKMFDGSSIGGWKGINESDMVLMPDASSAHLDPFYAQTTLAVFCDVLEPLTNEPYERDPRSIAGKAQNYLKQTGVGDVAVFGPEAEFFVFDDVRFSVEPFNCGYKIDSTELPTFYMDFPKEIAPLTKAHRDDPRFAEKWDLVCWGAEQGKAVGAAYAEGFRQHLGHAYPQDNILRKELGDLVHIL